MADEQPDVRKVLRDLSLANNLAAAKALARDTLAQLDAAPEGACPDCGAYRIDGQPPRVHERGCPRYEDGLTETVKALADVEDTHLRAWVTKLRPTERWRSGERSGPICPECGARSAWEHDCSVCFARWGPGQGGAGSTTPPPGGEA
jgi:hypothetical protein